MLLISASITIRLKNVTYVEHISIHLYSKFENLLKNTPQMGYFLLTKCSLCGIIKASENERPSVREWKTS
jgi:hypothetical protein